MQKKQIVLGIFLVFFSMMIAKPPYIFGNETKSPPPQEKFSKEALNQMIAPIALYPDTLLTQMLVAATYPLEVVAADRWVKDNPNLKEGALDEALKNKDWNESVKSLSHYPRFLSMMGEKIKWTTQLGNAFLSQKDEVMDTIREQRTEAEVAGNHGPIPELGAGYRQYPPPPVYPVPVSRVEVTPSFPSMICDLIFMRPAGMVALGIGLGATVVAMPFALPTGTMNQVSQKLIADPFNYTFVRPLGDWRDDLGGG